MGVQRAQRDPGRLPLRSLADKTNEKREEKEMSATNLGIESVFANTPPHYQVAVDRRWHSMGRGRVSRAHRPILPGRPRLPDRERQSPPAACPARVHSLLAGDDRSHDAALELADGLYVHPCQPTAREAGRDCGRFPVGLCSGLDRFRTAGLRRRHADPQAGR